MVSHAIEVKVRWSEADPAGIVFYPRFFEWFDLATEALFESLGLAWAEIFPKFRVVGVPIMESSASFRSPVRYGDVVRIRSTVTEVRAKTFRVEHEVAVGERQCASGFEVRAWVGCPAEPSGRLKARPFPEEVAARLKGQGGVYA